MVVVLHIVPTPDSGIRRICTTRHPCGVIQVVPNSGEWREFRAGKFEAPVDSGHPTARCNSSISLVSLSA